MVSINLSSRYVCNLILQFVSFLQVTLFQIYFIFWLRTTPIFGIIKNVLTIYLLKRKNKNESNIVSKPQYLQTFCFPYNSTTFSKPFTSLKYFYMADIWLDVNWRVIIRTFFGLDTIPKLQCKFRQPEMRKKNWKSCLA